MKQDARKQKNFELNQTSYNVHNTMSKHTINAVSFAGRNQGEGF